MRAIFLAVIFSKISIKDICQGPKPWLHMPKRSTHHELFYEKGGLENFAKCKVKILCWSLLLTKLQGCSLLLHYKVLLQRYFSLYFAKIFKSNFIMEHLWATLSDQNMLKVLTMRMLCLGMDIYIFLKEWP